MMHGATSRRRQGTRLYQAAERSIEPAADCRHGNSNAMNSPGSDSPPSMYTGDGKLFAFDLALERAAFTTRHSSDVRQKDGSGKVCFKKLEKRDRNNAAVVQQAIKIPFRSRHPSAWLPRGIREFINRLSL